MTQATAAKSNPFDPALFKSEAISTETLAANEAFRKATSGGPEWWDIGAPAFREIRTKGGGPFPPIVHSDKARTILVDGKGGRKIALNVIAPERARGVYLHIHGGGLVFGGRTSKTRCSSASCRIPAWLARASSTASRPSIPIPQRGTIAKPPRSGSSRTPNPNSGPTS